MWLLSVLVAMPVVQAAEAPAELSAEDEARARQLFENGRRLYGEGSYEAAIVAWEACYDLSKRPELLFNLSNAYERLGDARKALDLLNRYRAEATLTPDEHDRLARKASTLETRVNAAPPPPAQVDSKRFTGRDAAGAVIALTGTGALVVGALFGTYALDAREQVRSNCVDTGNGLLCPESAQASIDRAERDGPLSLVALGVGGLGLISGITLIATPGPQPKAGLEVTFAF